MAQASLLTLSSVTQSLRVSVQSLAPKMAAASTVPSPTSLGSSVIPSIVDINDGCALTSCSLHDRFNDIFDDGHSNLGDSCDDPLEAAAAVAVNPYLRRLARQPAAARCSTRRLRRMMRTRRWCPVLRLLAFAGKRLFRSSQFRRRHWWTWRTKYLAPATQLQRRRHSNVSGWRLQFLAVGNLLT